MPDERAARRKSISRTTRFEVFKRDQFTCQYCGRKAPDVVLQVDHIEPVARGGANDVLNYVTSCQECNGGKGARPLSDDSAVAKSRRQMEALADRREQLEMLVEWRRGLDAVEDHAVDALADYWYDLAPGWALSDEGRKSLRKLSRRFAPDEIMVAMRIAADQYLEFGPDGDATNESWGKAWGKIGGICSVRRSEREKPYLKDILYVRGILRNRLSYFKEQEGLELLERAAELGADIEWLKREAKSARSWTQWREDLEDWIAENEE